MNSETKRRYQSPLDTFWPEEKIRPVDHFIEPERILDLIDQQKRFEEIMDEVEFE